MSNDLAPGPARLIVAPGLTGPDGVSRVSAQSVRALASHQRTSAWSLHDAPGALTSEFGASQVEVRGAGGDRVRFAAWGLRAALRPRVRYAQVLVMHLHLAPVTLPLVMRGATVAVFLHGIEAWTRLPRLRWAALARSRLLVANSSYTLERFRSVNPDLASVPAVVCHLGVGAEPLQAAGEAIEPGHVLVVGRMTEGYKGHDELLEAWPALLSSHPGARLVCVGDGPERLRLEARARALGLARAVTFTGRVSDEVLVELYRTCAFMALPSLGEGFGLVFLEAMRAGKACLAGPGAPEEVVLHEETGLIVDPRRPEALVTALRRLLGDPTLCARLGQAGRLRWATRFTAGAFADRLRNALEHG